MRTLSSRAILGAFLCLFGTFPFFSANASIFRIPEPIDAYWQRQWYLRQIEAPEAWRLIATSTKQIIVAVIDAGVDGSHPDLQEAMWTNPGEIPNDGIDNERNGFIDDIHGWNFVRNSADIRPEEIKGQPEEAWSHGTFVSSLIGAHSMTHPGMLGVNQDAIIMPIEALDGDGYGDIPTVLDAIRYAINNGASIINLSLAGFDISPELERMIQHAHDAGVLVVAATGNGTTISGRDVDRQPVYPACFDGATNLIVGVSGTDSADRHAPYANYGRTCTDLSAPGHDMFGARPSYPRQEEGTSTTEKYLEGMSGTSLAAPLVSGVASLLKAVRPELTVDQLHRILVSSADSIEANLEPNERGKMGSGRLNARKAMIAALALSDAGEQAASIAIADIAPTTSTEILTEALSFSYQTSSTQRRWIIAPKPLWYAWSVTGTTPIVTTFGKEGKSYLMKRWDPVAIDERVIRITPSKGQDWKQVVSDGNSSTPSWVLLSSKQELRLVRSQDQKVRTLPKIKGISSKAYVTWDVIRQSWIVRNGTNKKAWIVDLRGTIRSL